MAEQIKKPWYHPRGCMYVAQEEMKKRKLEDKSSSINYSTNPCGEIILDKVQNPNS